MTKVQKENSIVITPMPETMVNGEKDYVTKMREAFYEPLKVWYKVRPDIFQGDEYVSWNRWFNQLVGDGFKAGGMSGDNIRVEVSTVNRNLADLALVYTQEGYSFYNCPASMAVTAAIAGYLGIQMNDREEYLNGIRHHNQWLISLTNWMIDNPRQFDKNI